MILNYSYLIQVIPLIFQDQNHNNQDILFYLDIFWNNLIYLDN